MRLFRRQAVEDAERRALKAHRSRSTERQAEIETLEFLLTSIKKRHTWDRIKGAIATGIPAFWILMIALRPSLPTWLHPLLENVPATCTIAVSIAVGMVVTGTTPATARSAARIGTTTERTAATVSRRTARPKAPRILRRASGPGSTSYRGANRSARTRSSTWIIRTEMKTRAGTRSIPRMTAWAIRYAAPMQTRPRVRVERARNLASKSRSATPAAASPRRGNPRRGSGIESTSRIDQTTRSARVTEGAARNTIAIMRDAAMHPSYGGSATTGSRDPSPRLGRRAAAGQSDSPAQAARSGMRSRALAMAPRDATRSRAATGTRSRRHSRAPQDR